MKKFLYLAIFLFSILLVFSLCTPYDSDKVNTGMIQGQWLLIDSEHIKEEFDSLFIDYEKERIILHFEQDKCIQYLPYLNDTTTFSFYIHDYKLNLSKDSIPVNTFGIVALTGDSLILQNNTTLHKYIKMEQY